MCEFFSFLTARTGEIIYADHKLRKKEKYNDHCDSHSWLAEHFRVQEDKLNKYEYNFMTGYLTRDSIVFDEDLDHRSYRN